MPTSPSRVQTDVVRRLLLVLPLVLLGCGDDDDLDAAATTTTEEPSAAASSSPPSTTTTEATTTSTTTFDGSTSPTSAPGAASGVALLTDVEVDGASVTFTFEEGDTPGFDVAYVEPPIRQDGSGEEIEVDGRAFLAVRMEPAAGVDLSGEEFRQTYTGPDRIRGEAPIVEAVETGDFEANLSWVVGLDGERPFRIETGGGTLTVRFAPS